MSKKLINAINMYSKNERPKSINEIYLKETSYSVYNKYLLELDKYKIDLVYNIVKKITINNKNVSHSELFDLIIKSNFFKTNHLIDVILRNVGPTKHIQSYYLELECSLYYYLKRNDIENYKNILGIMEKELISCAFDLALFKDRV